jgi:hypothetical protein
MKPVHWLALGVAAVVCVVLAGLSWRPVEASSGEMPTLTKKPAAKKKPAVARKAAASAPARSAALPADLRPLRAGRIKFSAAEVALMDRADAE